MPKYEYMGLVFGDSFSEERCGTLESIVDLARGREFGLGGKPDVGAKIDSYVDVPGAEIVRLDANVTALLRGVGMVSGGTGYMRLYSITAAAEVADSEVSFTDTTPTLQEAAAELELVAGDYKLQVKASSASEHVVVWGARLVSL